LGEVSWKHNLSACGNCDAKYFARARTETFAELPDSTQFVDLAVTIDQAVGIALGNAQDSEERRLWHGTMRLPVTPVGSVEEALPSTDDRKVTAAVKRTFYAYFIQGSQQASEPSLGVYVGGEHAEFPDLEGVAISVTVQLRHDGDVVRELPLIASLTTLFTNYSDGLVGRGSFEHTPPEFLVPGADLDDWDLNVVGVSKGVLLIWEADRWWSGTFSVPLADALRAGEGRNAKRRR